MPAHALYEISQILVQRDEEDPEKRPKLFYSKLPPKITQQKVVVCDPMLATGGSAKMCIDVLVKAGCDAANIMFVNVVACPEGIIALNKAYPLVKIVTAAVDDGLDENKYIGWLRGGCRLTDAAPFRAVV